MTIHVAKYDTLCHLLNFIINLTLTYRHDGEIYEREYRTNRLRAWVAIN